MESLVRDIRHSIRALSRTPWFTAAVVLTFALGIGANSATYSIVRSLLLYPLPCEKPEEVMLLDETFLTLDGKGISGPALDWKDNLQAFRDLAAYAAFDTGINLGVSGKAIRVDAAEVTPSFFSLLQIDLLLGRPFTSDEEQPGKNRVTVISSALWESQFEGFQGILGQVVSLNDTSFTVIGVARPDFRFPNQTDLWIPISLGEPPISTGSFRGYQVIGRLNPGQTVAQGQLDVQAFSNRYRSAGLDLWPARRNIKVSPLLDKIVGDYRLAIMVLSGAVCLVLLIACANVTNLLLTRAATCKREIAIRAALGASPQNLVRLILIDSVLLSLGGGALGLYCAYWFLAFLVSLRPPGLMGLAGTTLDGKVIAFTFGVSFVTGVVSGLAPAIHSMRMRLGDALKEGAAKGRAGHRVKSIIVVSEIALALLLLIGAGLLIRSLTQLRRVDLGFNPANVVTMSVDLPREDTRRAHFYTHLIERLRAVQGVEAVGAINALPLSRTDVVASLFDVEGKPAETRFEERFACSLTVTPEYFRAMRIPLIAGRFFTDQDAAGTTPVVIINQSLANQYWSNEDPVGRRLKLRFESSPREIVGVVRSVKHFGFESTSYQEVYFPETQSSVALKTVVVRTASNPSTLISGMRQAVHDLASDLPVYDVKVMADRIDDSTGDRRFTALVLGVFAAIALVLAAGGIHSVVAYSVSQTKHEIGVRMALGAQRSDVLSLLLRKALLLSLKGVAIGLLSAVLLTRLLSSLLYGLQANDLLTLALTTAGVVCASLIAGFLPAYRATKLDPASVFRSE